MSIDLLGLWSGTVSNAFADRRDTAGILQLVASSSFYLDVDSM